MNANKKAGCVASLLVCLSLVAAASAMAVPPEFTTVPNTFTGTSGVSVLTAGNVVITCKTDSISNGKVTGVKTATATIVFKECTGSTSKNTPCAVRSPGAASGEIVTNNLTGTLGYVSKPPPVGTPLVVGLKMVPTSPATVFVEIEAVSPGTCIVKSSVTGSLICEVTPLNTVTTKGKLICLTSSGKQKIRKFEGEEVFSELKAFGVAAQLEGTEEVTFATAGEVKA